MNHISIKNLSVKYENYCVLENIDFEVEKNEFVAIIGRSGSGKTTFLKALAGFIPFSGQINIPKSTGIIFQDHAIFPWLTVSENIAFGLNKKSKLEQIKIIKEHLKLAKLEDKKDGYPAELSGGQIQRVALAQSLAHDSEVLLMDEPYGSLDAYTREKMQQWLLDVWTNRKKTIIFVTHDIEEAIFLADRILVLDYQKFVKEYVVPFGRNRTADIKFSPEFNKLKKEIFKSLNS